MLSVARLLSVLLLNMLLLLCVIWRIISQRIRRRIKILLVTRPCLPSTPYIPAATVSTVLPLIMSSTPRMLLLPPMTVVVLRQHAPVPSGVVGRTRHIAAATGNAAAVVSSAVVCRTVRHTVRGADRPGRPVRRTSLTPRGAAVHMLSGVLRPPPYPSRFPPRRYAGPRSRPPRFPVSPSLRLSIPPAAVRLRISNRACFHPQNRMPTRDAS